MSGWIIRISSWRIGMNASGEGSRQPAAKRSTKSAWVAGGVCMGVVVAFIQTVCI
jgi:hypothetical protein